LLAAWLAAARRGRQANIWGPKVARLCSPPQVTPRAREMRNHFLRAKGRARRRARRECRVRRSSGGQVKLTRTFARPPINGRLIIVGRCCRRRERRSAGHWLAGWLSFAIRFANAAAGAKGPQAGRLGAGSKRQPLRSVNKRPSGKWRRRFGPHVQAAARLALLLSPASVCARCKSSYGQSSVSGSGRGGGGSAAAASANANAEPLSRRSAG